MITLTEMEKACKELSSHKEDLLSEFYDVTRVMRSMPFSEEVLEKLFEAFMAVVNEELGSEVVATSDDRLEILNNIEDSFKTRSEAGENKGENFLAVVDQKIKEAYEHSSNDRNKEAFELLTSAANDVRHAVTIIRGLKHQTSVSVLEEVLDGCRKKRAEWRSVKAEETVDKLADNSKSMDKMVSSAIENKRFLLDINSQLKDMRNFVEQTDSKEHGRNLKKLVTILNTSENSIAEIKSSIDKIMVNEEHFLNVLEETRTTLKTKLEIENKFKQLENGVSALLHLWKTVALQGATRVALEWLLWVRARLAEDTFQYVPNRTTFECESCFDEIQPLLGVRIASCGHEFCRECAVQQIKHATPSCLSCGSEMSQREISGLCDDDTFSAYQRTTITQAQNQEQAARGCMTIGTLLLNNIV